MGIVVRFINRAFNGSFLSISLVECAADIEQEQPAHTFIISIAVTGLESLPKICIFPDIGGCFLWHMVGSKKHLDRPEETVACRGMVQSLWNRYIQIDLDSLKFSELNIVAMMATIMKTLRGDRPIKYQNIIKHIIIWAAVSA